MPVDDDLAAGLREIWAMVYTPEPGSGLTFPETVHLLSALGVNRYRVDFLTNTATAYIGSSAHVYHFPSYATEFRVPGTIPWSLESLRMAIKKARLDAKNLVPDLPTYTRQIIEAGVVCYTCYIEGRKVTYNGYLGDAYSAWFITAGERAPINCPLQRRNTTSQAPGSI